MKGGGTGGEFAATGGLTTATLVELLTRRGVSSGMDCVVSRYFDRVAAAAASDMVPGVVGYVEGAGGAFIAGAFSCADV